MKWSAGAFFGLLSDPTLAFTSTAPAFVRGGETAVQTLVELQLTDVARPLLNLKVVAAPNH